MERLKKIYSILWGVQKFITVTVFFVFLMLVCFTQLSYYLSPHKDDENYGPVVITEETPFLLCLLLNAIPNTLQALGELIVAPDAYGVIDENTFSGALKTQLRKNFLLRLLYLTYRVRVWTSGALQRQKDGVELDYKVFSSQYNVWNQAAEEFSENQDRNQDTPADSEN